MEFPPVRAIEPMALSAAATPPPEQAADMRQIIVAVRSVNKAELLGQNNELAFRFDRETGQPVIQIIDRRTREVVRQIPPEYVLKVAQQLLNVD